MPFFSPPATAAQSVCAAIVIGHRGASGYRPEHTLAAYELAILQGVDFIEPDLVATRDGVLIARHENLLAEVELDSEQQILRDFDQPRLLWETTDIAHRASFAHYLRVKQVDGQFRGGWFSEDLLWSEIEQLRARERIPLIRPDNASHNDRYVIPRLEQIIDLVRLHERAGRRVGIYPELKHPTYFAFEARDQDGATLSLNLAKLLLDVLVKTGFTDPDRVFIQAFEIAPLIDLKVRQMPLAGVNFPLVQLLSLPVEQTLYDVAYHKRVGSDLNHVYGALAAHLKADGSFAGLARPDILKLLAAVYADGLGPNKDQLLLRSWPAGKFIWPPTEPATLTGEATALVEDAHRAGLVVHPYTLRAEAVFLAQSRDGRSFTFPDEAARLLSLGSDGLFADQPDQAVAARQNACRSESRFSE